MRQPAVSALFSSLLLASRCVLLLLAPRGVRTMTTSAPISDTFLYFAYGSNLLQQRLHVSNPSAVRKTHAKLEGYRLDFCGFSNRWGGSAATIEPDSSASMWGAVWELDAVHRASLDTQEGVEYGVYRVLHVNVTTEQGETLECRTYRYNNPEPLTGGTYGALPESRRPSPLYLETILRGAAESNLPSTYRELLGAIPVNSHQAGLTLDQFLATTALVNRND